MRPHFGGLPGGRTLFIDLDGVLANFDDYFETLYGAHPRDYCAAFGDAEMWKRIEEHGSFFRSLPPCFGALQFYSRIIMLNPIILTACPKDKFEDVARQKRGWVRDRLGPSAPVVMTPGAKSKPLYMHQPGDVLIDDFLVTVERWREAGGFGIHHTGDFARTQQELCDYLWPNPFASGMNPVPAADHKTISRDTMTDTPTASHLDAATVNLPEEKPYRLTPA